MWWGGGLPEDGGQFFLRFFSKNQKPVACRKNWTKFNAKYVRSTLYSTQNM